MNPYDEPSHVMCCGPACERTVDRDEATPLYAVTDEDYLCARCTTKYTCRIPECEAIQPYNIRHGLCDEHFAEMVDDFLCAVLALNSMGGAPDVDCPPPSVVSGGARLFRGEVA